MNASNVVIVVCLICLVICGPAQAIIWYALIADLNDVRKTPQLPLWGRASWSQTREVLKLHRSLLPNSHLRKFGYAAIVGALLSMLVMIGIATTHPGPSSRPASTAISNAR